jgi:hypothetical protein
MKHLHEVTGTEEEYKGRRENVRALRTQTLHLK